MCGTAVLCPQPRFGHQHARLLCPQAWWQTAWVGEHYWMGPLLDNWMDEIKLSNSFNFICLLFTASLFSFHHEARPSPEVCSSGWQAPSEVFHIFSRWHWHRIGAGLCQSYDTYDKVSCGCGALVPLSHPTSLFASVFWTLFALELWPDWPQTSKILYIMRKKQAIHDTTAIQNYIYTTIHCRLQTYLIPEHPMSILYVLQTLYLLYRNLQAHAWSISGKHLQPNYGDGRAHQRGDARGTLCLDAIVEITSKMSQWTCQHNYFLQHRWFWQRTIYLQFTAYIFCKAL